MLPGSWFPGGGENGPQTSPNCERCRHDNRRALLLYAGARHPLRGAGSVGADGYARLRPFADAYLFHRTYRLRVMEISEIKIDLKSTITCPKCGHVETEEMPTDACQFFYDCKGCGEVLKPELGDCCVFCSYGTAPCPPIQQQRSCCSD
jgi:hypothetical protein